MWDLTPAQHARHVRALVLNFLSLPERFRLVAKELFYALLTGPRPPGEPELAIATVRDCFSGIKEFLTWADQRGMPTLAALTSQDLAAYQQHLVARRLSVSRRGRLRRHARLFWIYRAVLAADRLGVDPAGLDGWDGDPQRPGENRTERIPEQVMAPLLGWALRWVREFSDDVLRAHDEWIPLHDNTQPSRLRRGAPPAQGVRQKLTGLLARYRAEQRPLPGNTGRRRGGPRRGVAGVRELNFAHLAREVGCSPAALWTPQSLRMIDTAAQDLGIADGTWLRTPVRGRLEGQPWLPAIRYELVPELTRLLHAACYIVVAYLSGMRDSEVKHLRRRCLAVRRDNTGRAYRRMVASQAFKGEGSPVGVTATWVVGESVEQAIAVLEQLQANDQDLLFAVLPSSPHLSRRHANQAKTTSQTNNDLAAFVDWINAYCEVRHLPDRIPLVSGQRWRLTTSQFRRTLAWFIARRPGGVIAGAIAYRHQSVQMFEGYAGTSASGFRAEVEAEQALERGEQLLAMVEAYEHRQLAGPAAEEASTRLEEFRRHARAGFVGTVVSDKRRLKLIMRRHDPHVYHGKFVTCIHNPDRALCREPDDDGHGPVLPHCKPLACRNVALTAGNLAAWHEHLAHLDQALASADMLPPYVRHRLGEQREQIARFLAEHDQLSKGST